MSHSPCGISQNVSSNSKVYDGLEAAQGDHNKLIMESHTAASAEKQLTQQKVIQILVQLE